jgi:hypothetical protein
VGSLDKRTWTQREQKNLADAQTFTWEGIPQAVPPTGESIEGAEERTLVEGVVSARAAYRAAVAGLLELYTARDPAGYKTQRIANLQARLDPVRTYTYFLDAEIPPADLRPVQVDPEADAIFEKALKLHREGKPLPGITDYKRERAALLGLLKLIKEHPQSTKIAESAYYIGDIYKEYFNEDVRAVRWYERAWQWDPNIDKPARFQAATVWDLRLHNRSKAVELYRAVLEHEPYNATNLTFSRRRIAELTGQTP